MPMTINYKNEITDEMFERLKELTGEVTRTRAIYAAIEDFFKLKPKEKNIKELEKIVSWKQLK